jgi:hypothetical protein
MSKTNYDTVASSSRNLFEDKPELQTNRESRRDRLETPFEEARKFSGMGGGSRDFTKYTVGGFGGLFVLLIVVAFYLREDAKRTRQMSYASLVFLGAGALLCAYKGLYSMSDKKNMFTLFAGIFAAVFLIQTYYVREAYDDVDGTVSAEQEQANKLTYVGALAGAIGAGYYLYKRR